MSTPNSPCAACKFLRRKCTQECVFAPYFPPDQPQKFANVHRVFGASNVSKLLNELPASVREDAVNSLAYEAEARLRDPVYGCVGLISILQQRLKELQTNMFLARKELSQYIGAQALLPTNLQPLQPFQSPAYLSQQHLMGNPSPSAVMLPNNGLPLVGPAGGAELGGQGGQFLMGDIEQQRRFQQQQFHAQRMAAEQQEMMVRASEAKQEPVFNRDFQVTVATTSPSLGLGNFESSSNYQIQGNQQQEQQLHHQNQIIPLHHQEQQLQAELFLTPQPQQQPSPLQISQPRPSGTDEGGPVGSSC